VFALADELSEDGEADVFRRQRHLLGAIAVEVVPLAVVLARKPTLRDRRRQQICNRTKKTHNTSIMPTHRARKGGGHVPLPTFTNGWVRHAP